MIDPLCTFHVYSFYFIFIFIFSAPFWEYLGIFLGCKMVQVCSILQYDADCGLSVKKSKILKDIENGKMI